MNKSITIKDWTEDERPREKLLQKGPEALTDAELLAILIGSGTIKRTAVDLARDVLGLANNNLREMGRISIKELQHINGIGEARSIVICAAMELGRRRQLSEGPDRPVVNSCVQAAKIIVPHLQDLSHEVFYVLYLNQANRLVREEKISSGGTTATVVDIKMILKSCLLHNANQLLVAHNHPSGSKKPSEADIILTRKLKEAAEIMDIRLVDHLIIAGNDYLSMANEGLF
jgi:DNA repair protein RadC